MLRGQQHERPAEQFGLVLLPELAQAGASEMAFNPVNKDMYVTNHDSGTVSRISSRTNTVVATMSVGTMPRGIIFNFATGDVYATNDGSATVSRISTRTNTVVATIGVGNRPVFLAFDFMNSFVYVTNQFSPTVSVISGS